MNICGDIVDEILSRLPVKSLIRFKVVCKAWYLHIHSECFIAKHIKNQRTNEKTLIYHHDVRDQLDFVVSICSEQEKNDDDNDDDKKDNNRTLFHQDQKYCIKDMPLDFLNNIEDNHVKNGRVFLYRSLLSPYLSALRSENIQLIGTCNGLVCLVYRGWKADELDYYKIITLWNPATRDFKTLPSWEPKRPPPPRIPSRLLRLLQVNDHIGFGFNCHSNDYKVIRLVHYYNKQYVQPVAIYSLNTNSWRELDYSNVLAESNISRNGGSTTLFLGEKVYWLILAFDMLRNEQLLSFDMGKEVFQFISLPSEYISLRKKSCFTPTNIFTLHDSIALVLTTKMRQEIWSTKELGQGRALWIKVLNIEHVPGISRPLGFWKCKNSNDYLFMFTRYIYGKDAMQGVYINDQGKFKNDGILTIKVQSNFGLPLKLVTYVETLVSVK